MEFIETLQEGQHVVGHYLCKDKQTMQARNGKTYLKLQLEDKTGSLVGMVWEPSTQAGAVERGDVIKVDALISSYQGILQMSINRVRKSEAFEYQISDYYRTSRFEIVDLYKQILAYIDQVEDVGLKKLLQRFYVEDSALIDRLKRHPAAKSVHHHYLGGLLEHTVTVASIAQQLSKLYLGVNKDLVLAGALLHDIGKLREIQPLPVNAYSDEGQFIGHIVIGYQMIHERADGISELSPEILMQLEHMILSHHGELEFGSPKTPSTIEAMILHMADLSDSKIKQVEDAIQLGTSEGNWTPYHRVLGRCFYRPEKQEE